MTTSSRYVLLWNQDDCPVDTGWKWIAKSANQELPWGKDHVARMVGMLLIIVEEIYCEKKVLSESSLLLCLMCLLQKWLENTRDEGK